MNPRRSIRVDRNRNVFVPRLSQRLDAIARAMLNAGKVGNPADYVILWKREILDGDGIFRVVVEQVEGGRPLPPKPLLVHKSVLWCYIGGETARRLFWSRGRRVRDVERQDGDAERLPDPPLPSEAPAPAAAPEATG